MQTNDEAVRSVGLRAKDIVLAVARASEGCPIDIQTQLENDLSQLTECEHVLMAGDRDTNGRHRTMAQILLFTQELASRSKYKKALYKSQDAETAQTLDTRLTHAFHIFEESTAGLSYRMVF